MLNYRYPNLKTHVSYLSLSTLLNMYTIQDSNVDNLDLIEEFSDVKKSIIIDSILRGIPPKSIVLFKSRHKHIFINSKQLSILYMYIVCKKKIMFLSYDESICKQFRGKSFKQLSEFTKINLLNINFRTIVIEATDEKSYLSNINKIRSIYSIHN